MRKEDNATALGTYFSDVWVNAQISRSAFLGALMRKAWRQLFGNKTAHCEQPINNARQYFRA
jgi:hypothetical protein